MCTCLRNHNDINIAKICYEILNQESFSEMDHYTNFSNNSNKFNKVNAQYQSDSLYSMSQIT